MEEEEDRIVTPIASGNSAFSETRSRGAPSVLMLRQQPFLYPSGDDDAASVSSQRWDVHELERELRPVTALAPNVQRPVPVTPGTVAPVYSEDSFEDEDEEYLDEDVKMLQRRRQRWKAQMMNKERRNGTYDENGCTPKTLFSSNIVSAFRNELVDVLDKIGQGCGSLTDSDDEDDEEEDDESEDATTAYSRSTSTTALGRNLHESLSDVTARTKYRMKDPTFLRTFISTLTQTGLVVLHHRPGRVVRPTKCLAFLQQGFQENGRYQAPLLVWKPVEEDGEGDTVDIFSIGSLDKAKPIQLKLYPLAMPGRTVILKTNQDVILELRNEEDAFRFVHGIRWIVARLSFNLIIGNLSVSCEMLDVERKERGDRFGQFPSNPTEESHWAMAMNDVTCELVSRAASQPNE